MTRPMRNSSLLAILFGLSLNGTGCHHALKIKMPALTGADICRVIAEMSDIMVHDVTNPPLAARFFAYTCLAGYEIVAENDLQVKSFYGVLNDYPSMGRTQPARERQARGLLAPEPSTGEPALSDTIIV